MPKVCFSTLSCPDWSWREILDRGTAYGYDGVEVRLVAREVDLLKVPEFEQPQLAQRRRELNDAGFEVCGLASSVRFDFPSQQERAQQFDIGRSYVDLAHALGAGFVRVFGDVLPDRGDTVLHQAAKAQIAEGLDRLGKYAAQAKISIIIETHGDFSDSQIMRDTIQLVTSPAVGVLWDTHHPWRFCGEDLAQTFERLAPWIRHTHWKDSVTSAPRDTTALQSSAANQAHALMSGHRPADYVLFGDGEFPANECMQLLRSSNYDGWFSLEWEKMWHPEIPDPEIALPPFPKQIRSLWDAM